MTDAVIALDIGGTDVKSAVFDAAGTELGRGHLATPVAAGVPAVVDAIVAEIERLRTHAGAAVTIRGAGLIFPGVVDSAGGIAVYSTNIGWRDLPIRDLVAGRTGLPVAIDHDVRAAGRAEAERGAARGSADALYLGIGTGISGAVITGGVIVTGAGSMAGEIGHLPAYPDGEPCACGQRGCTETYASAAAVGRRYLAAAGGEPVTAPQVFARAAAGDPIARRVIDEAVTALARTLISATMLVDPEVIVIGGGLSLAGDALFDPLRTALQAGLAWRTAPVVRPARFGPDSGRMGAALIGWAAAGGAPATVGG